MDQIKKRLVDVFYRCSLIDNLSLSYDENLSLLENSSKEMDSFSYISTLVEIESEFGIEIPDEYLQNNIFNSMDSLCTLIEDLTKMKV